MARGITEERVRTTLDGSEFQFKCTACGHCCKGPGDVYFTEEDLQAIKKHLKLGAFGFARLKRKLIQERIPGYYVHRSGEACILLQNNRCSVYEVRPLQCKTYPFWPSNFQSRANFRSLVKECPGTMAGKGRPMDASAVTKKVKATEREFLKPQGPIEDTIML